MLPIGKPFRNVFFILTSFCFVWNLAIAQVGSFTVIEGGMLIDGTGDLPAPNSVIVIRGDRISSVGQVGEVDIPTGAHRIDAHGKFIIPGLIDAHMHMRDWMNELFLVHGVTSVIDSDNPTDWIIAQKEGIAKGKIRGPRIFASGVGFRCRGNCQSEEFSPARLSQKVQALAEAGVNQVFVGQDIPPPALKAIIEEAHKHGLLVSGPTFYTRVAIAYGIDCIAHTYGLAMGAVPEAVWEKITAYDGSDPLDVNPLDFLASPEADELMAQLLKNKVYLKPMVIKDMKAVHSHQEEFKLENAKLLNTPELSYIPLGEIYPRVLGYGERGIPPMAGGRFLFGSGNPGSSKHRRYQQAYQKLQAFLREFVSRGGKVLAGSDPPNYIMAGLALHHELQLLVDAGLSPLQALQAATLWPAQYLKKESEVGTIQPGRFADIVILDGDPLEDISNTKRIHMVLSSGIPQELRFHHDYSNHIPAPPRFRNSVPRISQISPTVVAQQTGGFQLTVRGSGFVSGSVVGFGEMRVPTKFASGSELIATIPPYLTEEVGTFEITVENPGPRGRISEGVYLIVKF